MHISMSVLYVCIHTGGGWLSGVELVSSRHVRSRVSQCCACTEFVMILSHGGGYPFLALIR